MLNTSLVYAFAIGLASPASTSTKDIVVAADGSVERYFGVPVAITIESADTLGLKHRRSSRYTGEGYTSRTVIFTGRRDIELEVIFNHQGEMLAIQTNSSMAFDSRGVRIGDRLPRAQALWPCGKLYYGRSIEGGHRYARFLTGTNIILEMSTGSFDNLPELKVETIKVVSYSTADPSRTSCPPKAVPDQAIR